jgi:mono/diheme cytochrome c family protein
MRSFVGGIIATILVLCLAAYLAIVTGYLPARADGPLMPGEKWVASTALKATIAREAPKPPYPYPETDADIANGAKLYVQNCAVCHGTAHSTPNAIARGLGVKAPNFAKHGVDDDPAGETYWKIDHGIRFTGMPAFDQSLDQRSIWDVAYFLSKKPKELPPAAKAMWENPKLAPAPTPMPAKPLRPGQGSTAP